MEEGRYVQRKQRYLQRASILLRVLVIGSLLVGLVPPIYMDPPATTSNLPIDQAALSNKLPLTDPLKDRLTPRTLLDEFLPETTTVHAAPIHALDTAVIEPAISPDSVDTAVRYVTLDETLSSIQSTMQAAGVCDGGSDDLGGAVWRDTNSDGLQDVDEAGFDGTNNGPIIVSAYDSSGFVISSTVGVTGTYVFDDLYLGRIGDDAHIRLEFSGLPADYRGSVPGSDNGTSIQFHSAGTCEADFAIHTPDRCEVNARGVGVNGTSIGASGEWLYIGDPNNPADGSSYSTTVNSSPVVHNDADQIGYGSVSQGYWIADRQITLRDYLAFLNDVDPANGPVDWEGGLLTEGIVQYNAGLPLGERWSAASYSCDGQNITSPDIENTAVNFISFILIARFANWAATGDVNQGAYTFASTTDVVTHITAVDENWPGVRIPTEDELYKSHYWDETNSTYNLFASTTLEASGIPILSGLNSDGTYTVPNGNVYDRTFLGTCFVLWQVGQGGQSAYGLYGVSGDSHDMFFPKNSTMPTSFHAVRPGHQGQSESFMRSSYRLETVLAYNAHDGIYYPSPSFRLASASDPCNRGLSIGNRVWLDNDADGIQDPNEDSLPSITVTLYDITGTQIANATTDANGEYYFIDATDPRLDTIYSTTVPSHIGVVPTTTVVGGLLPNTDYTIRVGLTQTALNTYTLALPNVDSGTTISDAVDSDAIVLGNQAVITLTTGDLGYNDHSFDIGFTPAQIAIEKILNTPDPVIPGAAVTFTIRITNTGAVTITTLPLTDTYSNTYLTYISATPSANTAATGQVTWNDLTEANSNGFGQDLAPNGVFDVVVTFIAALDTSSLPNSATINTAQVYTHTVTDTVQILNPTNVVLSSRDVTVEMIDGDSVVVLSWSTVNENDIVGFHVLRLDKGEDGTMGDPVRLTSDADIIVAQGASTGADYRYEDVTGDVNANHHYILEMVMADGTRPLMDMGTVDEEPSGWMVYLPVLRK
ncbi:MAG: SdrD B-like domain-containing protein [Chloroflexota bacterium]